MLCTVAYIVSCTKDHLLDTILLPLVATKFKDKSTNAPRHKYRPIFVTDKDKLPNIAACKLNKFLI